MTDPVAAWREADARKRAAHKRYVAAVRTYEAALAALPETAALDRAQDDLEAADVAESEAWGALTPEERAAVESEWPDR